MLIYFRGGKRDGTKGEFAIDVAETPQLRFEDLDGVEYYSSAEPPEWRDTDVGQARVFEFVGDKPRAQA